MELLFEVHPMKEGMPILKSLGYHEQLQPNILLVDCTRRVSL